jgi:signal transduction histidine kinase/ActR/RegA family two-component response regulator
LFNGPHFEWDGRDITCFDEGWRVVTPIYSAKRRIGIMVNDAAITKGAMKPAQQEVTAVFCSLLGNIIEHKRLEGRFLQSQKMEAVGRLAGGVAHDFNNILTAILGYSDFILRDGYTGKTEEYATEIKKAAERAAALTRQLLAFSRKQMLQPKVLDLNAAIAGMEGMLRRLIGENISLSTLPGRNLGRVKADLGQIEQIIMNLAVNARDAMREGGSLTIETGNVTFDEASVAQYAGLSPGSYVMLAITDTGHGMTKDVMGHLFEPFFTTKGLGLGTGLGLATCYGIIKQSGGHITVYSEPGQGSTFRIYLPRVDQASDSQAKRDMPADMPRGSETILIVEDEISVRRMTALTMRELGYTILEACNGKDALRVVQEHNGDRIDFVITDVTMPEMGGAELAHELAVLQPETKILFVSGYTENTIVHKGNVDAGIEFLSKPYMPSALARKVREILDGSTNSRK